MIKKIFSALLLATSLVACTDDYTDWSAPQTNPQPETVSFGNGSVTPVGVIDFAAGVADKVQVCSITAPTSSSADYGTAIYKLNLGNTSLDISADGMIASETLKTYIVSNYGKAPVEREITSTVEQWISNGATTIKTATSAAFSVKAVLDAPFIDSKYYLVGDMTGSGKWGIDDIVVFSHSSTNVYDDPVFTVKFETTKENQHWKIIPQKNVDAGDIWIDGVLGVADDGDPSLSGFLTTDKPGAGKIEKPGKYVMTINMMDGTFSITDAPTELYMTGDHYNWGGTWLPMTPCWGSDEDFWTIIYLHEGEQFKFAPQAGWGDDFGGQATIKDEAGANITVSGTNLVAGNAGWYLLYIHNGTERTFTVLEPNVYLIGETAGEWNVADSHKFTVPTTEDGTFESPAFAKDAELRMCVSIEGFDWWKTEFIIFDGNIAYRGRGGDQDRVAVKAGQKAYLNFAKGTGEIK